MKKVLLLIAVSLLSVPAVAQYTVSNSLTNAKVKALPVIRNQLGTGTPAIMDTTGVEGASYVDDGYYHTPQYMANFPTAATIWPRVVEVDCKKAAIPEGIICNGYHWAPEMGRGEYLFVIPRLKASPIPVPPPTPTIVYVEVPVLKKKE